MPNFVWLGFFQEQPVIVPTWTMYKAHKQLKQGQTKAVQSSGTFYVLVVRRSALQANTTGSQMNRFSFSGNSSSIFCFTSGINWKKFFFFCAFLGLQSLFMHAPFYFFFSEKLFFKSCGDHALQSSWAIQLMLGTVICLDRLHHDLQTDSGDLRLISSFLKRFWQHTALCLSFHNYQMKIISVYCIGA